ncbi:hypothetical protein ACOME3_002999 [Neoechinorhynchus agilis]
MRESSVNRRSSVMPMDAVDLFVRDGDASRRATPLPSSSRSRQHFHQQQSYRYPNGNNNQHRRFPFRYDNRNNRPLHPPIRFGRAPPFYHNDRQLIYPRVTYHCILCNMSCTSEDVFESHVIGQKHLKKLKRKRELQQQGVIEKVHQSELYCKLCNVELTNHDHMAMHMNGRKHKQNARKAGEQVNVELDCDLDAFAIPDDKKKDIPPMPAGQTQVFDRYCKHCDKFLSGKSQVLLHIKSHKHRMKVGEEIPAKKKKDKRLDELAAARKTALDAAKRNMRQRRPQPSYPNPMIAPLLKAFTPFTATDIFGASGGQDSDVGFGAFGPDETAEPMQFPPFEAFCGDIHRAFGLIDEDGEYDFGATAYMTENVSNLPLVHIPQEQPKGLDSVKPLFEIPEEEADEEECDVKDESEPDTGEEVENEEKEANENSYQQNVQEVAKEMQTENRKRPAVEPMESSIKRRQSSPPHLRTKKSPIEQSKRANRRSPSSRHRRSSPEVLRRRTPEVRRRSPDLSTRSSEVRRRSPEVRRRSPDLNTRSSEIRRRSPEVHRRSPDLNTRSSEVHRRSPDLNTRSSEVRRRSPEVRRRSPDLNHHSPGRRSPRPRRFSPSLSSRKHRSPPSSSDHKPQRFHKSPSPPRHSKHETRDILDEPPLLRQYRLQKQKEVEQKKKSPPPKVDDPPLLAKYRPEKGKTEKEDRRRSRSHSSEDRITRNLKVLAASGSSDIRPPLRLTNVVDREDSTKSPRSRHKKDVRRDDRRGHRDHDRRRDDRSSDRSRRR